MRVVLDANIYVSALITPGGTAARVVQRWLDGGFELVVSQQITDELTRVTGHERLLRKYAHLRTSRQEFIELVGQQAIWAAPDEKLAVVGANESDNRYVECAVAGQAQYIVSGDEHLLELGEYQAILVVSPAAYLTVLELE